MARVYGIVVKHERYTQTNNNNKVASATTEWRHDGMGRSEEEVEGAMVPERL